MVDLAAAASTFEVCFATTGSRSSSLWVAFDASSLQYVPCSLQTKPPPAACCQVRDKTPSSSQKDLHQYRNEIHDCTDVREYSAVQQTIWATERHSSDNHRQTSCPSLTSSLWDSSHDIIIADSDLSFALSSTTFTRIFAWSSPQRTLTCSVCGSKKQSPAASSAADSSPQPT